MLLSLLSFPSRLDQQQCPSCDMWYHTFATSDSATKKQCSCAKQEPAQMDAVWDSSSSCTGELRNVVLKCTIIALFLDHLLLKSTTRTIVGKHKEKTSSRQLIVGLILPCDRSSFVS